MPITYYTILPVTKKRARLKQQKKKKKKSFSFKESSGLESFAGDGIAGRGGGGVE